MHAAPAEKQFRKWRLARVYNELSSTAVSEDRTAEPRHLGTCLGTSCRPPHTGTACATVKYPFWLRRRIDVLVHIHAPCGGSTAGRRRRRSSAEYRKPFADFAPTRTHAHTDVGHCELHRWWRRRIWHFICHSAVPRHFRHLTVVWLTSPGCSIARSPPNHSSIVRTSRLSVLFSNVCCKGGQTATHSDQSVSRLSCRQSVGMSSPG